MFLAGFPITQAGSLVKRASNGMSIHLDPSSVSALHFLRHLRQIISSLGQVFHLEMERNYSFVLKPSALYSNYLQPFIDGGSVRT